MCEALVAAAGATADELAILDRVAAPTLARDEAFAENRVLYTGR